MEIINYITLKINELFSLNEKQETGTDFFLIGMFILLASFLFWRYYKSIGVRRGTTFAEAYQYASYTKSIVGMCMGGMLILIGIVVVIYNR